MHWGTNGLEVHIIQRGPTLKIQKGSTLKIIILKIHEMGTKNTWNGLKIHETNATEICAQQNIKKQILTVALQNYTNTSFKRLCKNLYYLFFHEFFRNIFQTDLIQMLKQFQHIYMSLKLFKLFNFKFRILF